MGSKASARTRSVGDDPLQLTRSNIAMTIIMSTIITIIIITRSNIAMKPVQNLDSLNPATGLPNIGVLSF